MSTFNAYFKKEMLESSRQYKYIVLGIGILLFSILDPIMLKLLPVILKSQIPADLSSLMVATEKSGLQNYVKDLFQIGNLFVTLSLMGILSDEINSQKLVLPCSKGCGEWGIVLSKTIHYSLVVIIFIFIGFSINFYYCSLLFSGDSVSLGTVMYSAILVSLYYAFNISMIVFLSSIFKKGIAAGIAALVISYFMPLLINIKAIAKFVPYTLMSRANSFTADRNGLLITVLVTALYIIVLNAAAVYKLKRTEIV